MTAARALPRREANRIARERRILDAAVAVFSRAGYTGASMDDLAAQAGLSKPTLYQYFPSKHDLFRAMMLGKRADMLTGFDSPVPGDMVAQLHGFAWRYADVVLAPDMLALARLTIGEAQRFPEIGRAYQRAGPDRLLRAMMRYLTEQRAAGRLHFDDAELAAQDLWGLILSAPRTRALHDPDWQPDDATLARYIHHGLEVFLRACSARPDADLARLAALAEAGRPARQTTRKTTGET